MIVVTVLSQDLGHLALKFNHIPELKFSSMKDLIISIDANSDNRMFEISRWLKITHSHIDGKQCVFMYGNGYALEGVFGKERVYGK